jgi:hypothetical protein
MNRETRLFIIAFSASVHCCGQSYGLEAKLADTKLHRGTADSSAVYDGIDSVYIFGGR